MKNKMRNSNYELLRITSMLLIIFGHVMLHGMILGHATGTIGMIVNLLEALLIIHVNSFILVTGYYQCKSEFKLKKVISLNNMAWFYRVLIMIIFLLTNVISLGKVDIFRNAFPIDLGFNWFVNTYLILYCLSPFLNILISKMNKQMFKRLLIVLFLVFSLIPTLTRQQAFADGNGYSITNFIFLYLIGAYLRNYPIAIWDYFKISSDKMKQLVYIFLFFVFCFVNYAISTLGLLLLNQGGLFYQTGSTIMNAVYAYDNPLVIAGTIAYFLWFGCLKINSKFINIVGSSVFGIYLIHENYFIRKIIFDFLGPILRRSINSYMIFPKMVIAAIAIFVICSIIELTRQLLFKGVSKLWISKKIKERWYNYLKELKSN